MSSSFSGHAEGTVSGKNVSKTGSVEQIDIPVMVQMYNKYMGGVDKPIAGLP